MSRKPDAETLQFMADLERSLQEALAGEGRVTTPEQIMARRKPGRPAGTTKADAKVRTTIRLDPDVLEAFKARGAGWQTRINDVLRADIQAGRI